MQRLFLLLIVLVLYTQEALSQHLGVEGLMIYETQHINREVDPNRVHPPTENLQKGEYKPETAKTFNIKSFWIDLDKLHSFSVPSNLNALFFRETGGKKQALLLVHPESIEFYGDWLKTSERGPVFKGRATSSSRTVLVWLPGQEASPFFAKLSLNKRIGGVVRTIPAGEVARSIGGTVLLNSEREKLPKKFQYFEEVIGIMPKGFERGGMIIREIPEPLRQEKIAAIPVFSIATPDKQGNIPLVEFAAKQGVSEQSIVERIIREFVGQYLELTIEHGISMEPHGQNILIEVDSKGRFSGRILHRDFGGFNFDLEYRKKLGIAEQSLPLITGLETDYHQSKHTKSIDQAFFNYFEGGVIFPIQQAFNSLEVLKGKVSELHFSKFLFSELESQLLETYKVRIKLNSQSLSHLSEAILQARLKYEKVGFKKPPKRCRSIF